jgi:hypothetical protein
MVTQPIDGTSLCGDQRSFTLKIGLAAAEVETPRCPSAAPNAARGQMLRGRS